MTNEQIIEGNKLIAAFMGGICKSEGYQFGKHPAHYLQGAFFSHTGDLFYHERWDWIMPVVEMIRQLDEWYEISISKRAVFLHTGNERCDIIYHSHHEGQLGAVYAAVTTFITWHNSQQKETE